MTGKGRPSKHSLANAFTGNAPQPEARPGAAAAGAAGAAAGATAGITIQNLATAAGVPQAAQMPQGPLLLLPLTGLAPAAGAGGAAGAVPPPLEELSLEQLRRMEGLERAAVEERLRFLRQVHAQVSALIVALSQFQQIPVGAVPAADSGTASQAAPAGPAPPAEAAPPPPAQT